MKVERINIDQIIATENSRGNVEKNIVPLMNSIQQHGLEHPIGVNYNGKNSYAMVYGNRRLSACIKLGWKSIPAVIYTELDDKGLLVKNLIENVQRENISPAEVGRICEQLEKKGLTIAEMSVRLDMPESTIKTAVELYKHLPEDIRSKVFFQTRGQLKKGRINVSTATRILGIRQEFGLSKVDIRKLFEYTRVNELSNEEIKVVTLLMKDGLTFKQALDQQKMYGIYRVDIVTMKDELETLSKDQNIHPNKYIAKSAYGLNPPITKPRFLDLNKNGGRYVRKSKNIIK